MEYHFTLRYSDALEGYTRSEMVDLMQKFSSFPIEAYVTFESDRHLRSVRCDLTVSDGFCFHAKHESDNMIESVDRAIEKIGSQLQKRKGRRKAARKEWAKTRYDYAFEEDNQWSSAEEDDYGIGAWSGTLEGDPWNESGEKQRSFV